MSQKEANNSSDKKKSKRKNGDGSVYEDTRRGKHAASIFDINGKRQRAYFDTEDEAHAWRIAQKIAREKGEGTFVRDPKSTLEEYLNDWLLERKGLTPNSIRYYSQTIKNRINPHIGNIKLKHITPKVIEDFLHILIEEKGYKGGTVRGVIRTLNKAFNDGARWGELHANPMKKVIVPKLVSTPSSRIPREDVVKLRAEAKKNPFDRAKLEIGIAIGLRPGEVAGLKWKDFDEKSKRLTIERQIQRVRGQGLIECSPKTSRKKPIPLIEGEVETLRELKRYQSKIHERIIGPDDYIFPNSIGRPMDSVFDRKWFRNLCVRAGVTRYQRYQMRKTAFTELSHFADLGTVKAYSGHTQISTLINHYIDPEETVVRAALRRRREAGLSYGADR